MIIGKFKGSQVIALVILIFSLIYFAEALKLEWGSLNEPGPGFLPITTGFALLFFSALYFFRQLKYPLNEENRGQKVPIEFSKTIYLKVYGTLGCMVAYAILLEIAKFIIASTIITFFLLFCTRPQKVFNTFLGALLIVIVSFLIFAILLEIGLPFGWLENILFSWFS